MGIKIITKNKRASYDYFLSEFFEAGLVLQGTEVKSIRNGKGNINDAFVTVDKSGEAWIHNMRIPPYEFGTDANHEETRKRKLLLSKKEIIDISHEMQAKSLTIVPTKLYFKRSLIKIEIAMAKGKKLHDKRDSIIKKDASRKILKGEY